MIDEILPFAEVERVSEGQRYTTKLLSEKARSYSERVE